MKAIEIIEQIKNKNLKAYDLTVKTIANIKAKNEELNAFVEVFEDSALKQAKEIDAKIEQGKTLGKLAGVPIAIKDNLGYKGHKATCASKMLKDYVSIYNATVVQKLLDEDAIIIGSTNMDEFAMGASNENSIYGPVKNPHNTNKVSGGSSGGSACAVGANLVPISLGSDTGGSIRQPASFCGSYGIKPTYGRVSRYGLTAFASSLDQIGVFANNPQDLALATEVISDYDKNDSTSVKEPQENYSQKINTDLSNKTIGIIKEEYLDGLQEEIKEQLNKTKERLIELGAKIIEVDLPNLKYSIPCYYVISGAQASSNLSRFDGIRFGHNSSEDVKNIDEIYINNRTQGFGEEVKRRIMLGTYVLSSGYYDKYYSKAQKVKDLIISDFNKIFKDANAILLPTTPTTAFDIGSKSSDPVQMYLCDLYTCSVNLSGIAAISIPSGKDKNDLPIGIQLIADKFKEQELFDISSSLYKEPK